MKAKLWEDAEGVAAGPGHIAMPPSTRSVSPVT
jgi:hypothetical protein